MQQVEEHLANSSLAPGGHWSPPHCTAHHRVAILIPYRNREMQLRIFLNVMHPFLQKQQIDYRIYVIEPVGLSLHGREAVSRSCVAGRERQVQSRTALQHRLPRVFQAIPVAMFCLSRRRSHPRGRPQHLLLSARAASHVRLREHFRLRVGLRAENPVPLETDVFALARLPYRGIFGGVSVMTTKQMEAVNGFSNQFFGWGAEDDGTTCTPHQRASSSR